VAALPAAAARAYGDFAVADASPGDVRAVIEMVVGALPDAAIIVDAASTVIGANQPAEELLGYPPGELVGLSVDALIPEQQRASHHDHVDAFLASPRPRSISPRRLNVRRRDGTVFPARVSLGPIASPAGLLVLASIHDATDRARILGELDRAEAKLAAALALARAGAWELDLATGASSYSPGMKALLRGAVHSDFAAFVDTVHPDDRASLQAAVAAAADAGAPLHLELRVRTDDGCWRWFEAKGDVLRDDRGRPAKLRGMSREITEEKLARDEVIESRAELSAVVAAVPDTVVFLDRDGQIRFSNRRVPARRRLGGLPTVSWRDHVPVENHAAMQSAIDAVIERGETVSRELSDTTEEGGVRHYVLRFGPVVRDEAIVGVVLLITDVTQRKEEEARLAAADQMATLGMISASVAHEINNPLAAVISNLDLLAGGRLAPTTAREALDEAREAAARIRAIAGDLLMFSRIDRGPARAVDLDEVVEASIRLAANELRHRAPVRTRLGARPQVVAIESQLCQVIINLLVNAAHAFPTPARPGDEIVVTTGHGGDGRVFVEVADNGVGMTPEVRGNLFTPFFTTKPPGAGTGLGLAITQRIVGNLGGEVAVDSAAGGGTRFRVWLPAAAPVAAASAPPDPVAPAVAPRRARILVVDDEDALRNLLARVLGDDHDVVATASVAAALDAIRGHDYDLILCDLMMPGQSGIDLHAELERIAPALLPRVSFVTGGAFTAKAREFLERSRAPILEKPFSVDELLDFVAARLA